MESKPMNRVDSGRVVEDFEPSMEWVRDTGADTLQIDLPGFNKEQLKVQVTSRRVLRISGERQLNNSRWSTFRKEIPISSNYDTKEINARFDKGILYVKHPKVIVLEQTSSAVNGKVEPPSKSATGSKEQQREKPTSEQQPETHVARVGMEKQDVGKIEREENDNFSSPKTPTKEKTRTLKNAQVEAEAEGIATRSKSAKLENPDDSSLDSTNTIKDKAEKGKLAMESYRKGFSGVVMDMKKSRTLVNLVLVILFILVLGMYGRNTIRSLKKSDN